MTVLTDKLRLKRKVLTPAPITDFFDTGEYGEGSTEKEDESPNYNPVLVFRSQERAKHAKQKGPGNANARGALSRMRFALGPEKQVAKHESEGKKVEKFFDKMGERPPCRLPQLTLRPPPCATLRPGTSPPGIEESAGPTNIGKVGQSGVKRNQARAPPGAHPCGRSPPRLQSGTSGYGSSPSRKDSAMTPRTTGGFLATAAARTAAKKVRPPPSVHPRSLSLAIPPPCPPAPQGKVTDPRDTSLVREGSFGEQAEEFTARL